MPRLLNIFNVYYYRKLSNNNARQFYEGVKDVLEKIAAKKKLNPSFLFEIADDFKRLHNELECPELLDLSNEISAFAESYAGKNKYQKAKFSHELKAAYQNWISESPLGHRFWLGGLDLEDLANARPLEIPENFRIDYTYSGNSSKGDFETPNPPDDDKESIQMIMLNNNIEKNDNQPRYFNIGFFKESNSWQNESILYSNYKYLLKFDIGSPWGIVGVVEPVPDFLFAQDTDRKLQVNIEFDNPDVKCEQTFFELTLPIIGASDNHSTFISLPVGKVEIYIHIRYYNHLVQSHKVSLVVLNEGEEVVQEKAYQLKETTFSRTQNFPEEILAHLKSRPRVLTMVTHLCDTRDENNYIINFYGTDTSNKSIVSRIKSTSLGNYSKNIRTQLEAMITNGPVDWRKIDANKLAFYLGNVAQAGFTFFRGIFQDHPDLYANLNLKEKDILQVSPITSPAGIPFEGIYDRQIQRSDTNSYILCDSYKAHGINPEDCPNSHNPNVVCPRGFWGYKFIIEQPIHRLKPGQKYHEQTIEINNQEPSKIYNIYFSKFISVLAYLNFFNFYNKNKMRVIKLTQLSEIVTELKTSDHGGILLDFYTHHDFESGFPFLTIGENIKVNLNDLQEISLDKSRPLIVFNACESAAYNPDSAESLLEFFKEKGASGIIGSQCKIKESLAILFSPLFYKDFFDAKPVGESLFEARRKLLFDFNDPRGLAYSLFADASIKLKHSIIS